MLDQQRMIFNHRLPNVSSDLVILAAGWVSVLSLVVVILAKRNVPEADSQIQLYKKWNELGFRPPLCSYNLTYHVFHHPQEVLLPRALAEAEHATSRSRILPTILNLYEWAGKKHSVALKGQSGIRTRDFRLSKQTALTTAPGPRPFCSTKSLTGLIEVVSINPGRCSPPGQPKFHV